SSSTAPAGYTPVNSGTSTSAEASVLLIQDNDPWGTSANQQVLSANGIAYDLIPSTALPTRDLSPYRVVIVPSDQSTSFYATLASLSVKLETFVSSGGVLEFHAAGWGWQGGDASRVTLPGGMAINPYISYQNRVLDSAHPLMAGVPNPFSGNAASHAYFTAIPAGAAEIASDDYGRTNLVVYPFGRGIVIAGGQTFEHGYVYGYDAGIILRNMIPYSVSRSPLWLAASPVSGIVPPGGSAEIAVVFDAAGLSGGSYAANLFVSTNDPSSPEAAIPAAMTVTGAPNMVL